MRLRVAILLLGNATVVAAQQNADVRGAVVDSATRRPVAGAIVTLRSGDKVMAERSDEAGVFRVPRLPTGEVVAEVKRIGYRLKEYRLTVRRDTTVTFLVAPTPASLARINVFGKGEGVFGTIARSADLRVIPGAKVLVVGSGVTAIADSAGQFFVPLKQPGAYLVRVTAEGYGEEVLPLSVKKNEVAESSQLLDASNRKPLSAGLWDDFDQRLRWRPINSALVSGAELRRAGALIPEALLASPSVIRRQLHIPVNACVYINGQPRPGATVGDFRVDDVRAIELYEAKDSIYLGILTEMWPKNIPCGAGAASGGGGRRPLGSARAGSRVPMVKWVVIWLR